MTNVAKNPSAPKRNPTWDPSKHRIVHVDALQASAGRISRLTALVNTMSVSPSADATKDALGELQELLDDVGQMLDPGHPWQRAAVRLGLAAAERSTDPDPSAELPWLATDLARLQFHVEELTNLAADDAASRAEALDKAQRLLTGIIGTVGGMISDERGAK